MICLREGLFLGSYLDQYLFLSPKSDLDLIEIQELEGKATPQKGIEIEVTVMPQESYPDGLYMLQLRSHGAGA